MNLEQMLQRKWTRYLAFVLLPTFLAASYLSLLAAEGYVSHAKVMVEQEDTPAAAGAELALGLLTSVSGGRRKQDLLLVADFMYSRTMLNWLDQELDLKNHFASPRVDFIGRLSANASNKEFLEFYQRQLTLAVDEDALIMEISFTAYDQEFAQRAVQALVKRSEQFVNDVSQQLAEHKLAFSERQVDAANARLKEASREMIQLQVKNQVFSPENESEAIGQILANLEVELAKQRTQFKALSAYLNPNAPDVIAAKQRVEALQWQLEQERSRLVGANDDGLNNLMLDYQDAEVEVRLATELYKGALATLEAARLDASRQVKYLVAVDRPNLPDVPEHPRIAYWTLTVFILFNLLYFVANLAVATIQDHRE